MAEEYPRVLEIGGTRPRWYRKPLRAFRWADIRALLYESASEWSRQKGSRLGASLAFYTLLSVAPLLLLAVSIGGLVFGHRIAESQLVQELEALIGPQGSHGLEALLSSVQNRAHGILATLAGLIALFFGASGAVLDLRDALNTIWEVPPRDTPFLRSLLQIVTDRLFSFALVLGIGLLLLASLVASTWEVAAGSYFSGVFPIPEPVLYTLNLLVWFLLVTGLFAAVYKLLPEPRLEWRDVLLGAAVTSFLFTVGRFLIGLYLGRASFASTYGAAASVVVLMIWVYYSGQIFYLGAEFTKIFTLRYGSGASVAIRRPRKSA